MSNIRKCAGLSTFNTGNSKCPFDPGKIKAIVLTMRGNKITDWSAEGLESACHADRPFRIYPIKTIVEYAPSGGEAQTSANGYGPTKVTGYSPKVDTWTLEDMDFSLKANLAKAKNVSFDAYLVDENNVVYGVNDGTDSLAGIPLSGVYPGGQDWDSSGTDANLTVTTMFQDYEKYLKTAGIYACDFDVVESLKGLVYVEFVSSGSGFKLVEHFGGLDVTEFYGEQLVKSSSTVLPDATAVSYKDGVLTGVTEGISLASPSVLQEVGVVGIEQWEV